MLIWIVLGEISSMMISVLCHVMGELREHKVAKRTVMGGHFQFSFLTMLKCCDVIVGEMGNGEDNDEQQG